MRSLLLIQGILFLVSIQRVAIAGATLPGGAGNSYAIGSILSPENCLGKVSYNNYAPCQTPTAQPTGFTASYLTNSGFTGSFSVAVPEANKYLVVRYPSGDPPVNPVDYTIYSTGGALGTGSIRSVTSSTIFTETGLTASTTYDYYIYSYNDSLCYGPVYYIASPLFGTVTTCTQSVGTPGTPSASMISYDQFTVSWSASSSLFVTYLLDVATNSGFTSFVPGYQSKNLGANLSEIIDSLTGNTTYYISVRAVVDSSLCFSPVSDTLAATTACNPYSTFPVLQDFEITTFPPDCWARFTGILENPSYPSISTSGWQRDDWRNVTVPVDKAARLNISGTTTKDWLVTQVIDLGNTTTYQLSFDLALVDNGTALPITNDPNGPTGIDDKFAVVISTDGGLTWTSANILRLWDNESSPYIYNGIDYLGERIELSLTGYTGIVRIGFYGESTISNADNEIMINNVAIEVPPACPKPRNPVTTNVNKTTADLGWSAGGLETFWEVKYGPPGFNVETEGTLITGVSINPYTLDPPLTPLTTYDWYVRGDCGTGGTSLWAGPISFTTRCDYYPITSTTPDTICGAGIADLTATSSGGTINWYNQFAGGSPLGTGPDFTTPVITSSTFFYVGTTSGGSSTLSAGPAGNGIGTGGYVNLNYYEVFDVLSSSMTLEGVSVYPDVAGDVKLVILNSSGTELARITQPVTTPQVKTFIPIGVSIPAGTGYRIGINTTTHGGGVSLYRNTNGAVYPYTVANLVSITGNTFSGYPQYYYYCYDWKVSTSCTSPRIKVPATVTPAPPLMISPDATICNNQVKELTVTAGNSDFDTFTWNPVTNLFTDSECQIPYTALTDLETVYFKSANAGPVTFTCTGSNSGTGCNNIDQTIITVLPASPTVSASNPGICISGNSDLTLTPATGWGEATFQWQESSDGVFFADIPGANSQSYTTPTITSTTYYRLLIKNSDGFVCSTPQDTVSVENVSITGITPGERCGTGTVTLEATGIGILTWFASATGGEPIGINSPFVTPIINSTRTFYVAAVSSPVSVVEEGGRLSTASPDGFLTSRNWGIVFDATQFFILNSTVVYPVGTGTITIAMVNSTGVEIAVTSPIAVTGTGSTTPVVVPLGFSVSPGTGYRLVLKAFTGITSLIRDISGSLFPYPSPSGALNVTSGYNGSATSVYYWFYRINLSIRCSSEREPVLAVVTPADPILPSAVPASICPGESSMLNVISSNSGYEYLWTPGNLIGTSQLVYPTTTTAYTVTANDPISGCGEMDTVIVKVNPVPSEVTITPATGFIGGVQQLVATGGTIDGAHLFGTGLSVNSNISYPAPYSNFYGGAKHQMVILASELTAAGVLPYSSINTISFHIAIVGSTFSGILNNFQISMKNTTTSVLSNTSFEPGLTLVYGPLNQSIPTSGFPVWVTHTISPYTWDGTSNILIETSYSNGTTGGTTRYVQMYITNAGFVSTNYYRANNASATEILNALIPSGSGNARPDMTLGVSLPTTLTWSPASGLWMDNPPTIPYAGQNTNVVFADPAAPVTYTATATNIIHGCTTTRTCVFTTLTKTLNLTTLFLEGLYAGSGTMNQAMGDGFVPQYDPGIADHITVELRNSADYNDIITTKTDVELSTSGTATTTIDGTFGGQYYLTIKHRNSIETVSATYLDFAPGTINYAFDVKEKAYGSNMGEFIDAQAAIYAGDVNQDGLIDGSDLNDIGNLNDIFVTGYLDEDVNGDGLVDGSDLNICGNNNDTFVAKITP